MADSEIISLADLKTYLKITTTDKDAILQDIKDFVESWIEKEVDRGT